MKRALSLILVAVMALTLVPAFGVFAAEGTPKTDAVVFLDGTAGADSNDGKTAATPVFSFNKAIEIANTYGDVPAVTIVITGLTTIGEMQHNITADSTHPLILTSYYDGVDYRENGAALTTPNFNVSVSYMNADYTFDYLNIKILNKQPIIAMQYNNLTVTENCKCIGIEGQEESPLLTPSFSSVITAPVPRIRQQASPLAPMTLKSPSTAVLGSTSVPATATAEPPLTATSPSTSTAVGLTRVLLPMLTTIPTVTLILLPVRATTAPMLRLL